VIAGCARAAVYCDTASPTLKNLTVVGNGYGVIAYNGSDPNIINCIVWGNTSGGLTDCKTVRYSDVQQPGTPDKRMGNVQTDPLFADPARWDYHLKSSAGRYVPQLDAWVTDLDTSPCIDAGDPREDPRGERMPNGGRVNMGAYGGTPYASKSD
jgi:parallel beta-helix repeat protein